MLKVLGSVEAGGDDAVRTLGTGQAREVLAFLVARRGQPASTRDVVDALWPESPPATAVTIVHGAVRRIRRALGAEAVVHGEGGYRLDLPAEEVDLWAVDALIEAGDRKAARARWRDPAFGVYAERRWARAAVEHTIAVIHPNRQAPPGLPGRRRLPVNRLVGRRRELAAVRAAQRRSRLVSIVGLGGVGKTRLAMARAGEEPFEEMTHVDVAAAVGPSASRLLRELGQPSTGDVDVDLRTVASLIGRQRQLLVLDGCEHDPQGSARLVEHLLARCPELSVLATSRCTLGVPGEHVVPLMPFEDPGDVRGDAVELLLERAQALGLTVTATDRPRAAEICERCAGVPLAIELAAGELLFDLDPLPAPATPPTTTRPPPATPPGARPRRPEAAVTDAVAQAVAGLSPATRRSARRAALLVAGFTPDLMATLHGPGASTLGALHELVGSGLVVAEGAHAARRLRFLDPVREDLRRGTTSEDLIAAQAALTAHLAAVRPHVAEPPSIPRLAAALGELANVEGMIDLLVEHGRHRERLALVTAASHTWQAEGHWVSGGQHIEDALVAAPDADPFDRARARCVQAFVGSTFDSARRLVPALLEAATVARDAGDLRLEAVLQMHLANGVGYAGQMEDAAVHLARLHELAHVTASEYLELGARMVESTMLLVLGDAAEARQELIEVARALEAFGAPSNAAQIYRLASAGARKLGLVDAALVDLERAEELAGEGLARGTLAMIRADIADLRFQQDPASSLPALTVALEAALGIGNLRAAGILRTRIGGVTSDAIVTAQGTLDLWPVDPRWAAASLARLLDRLPPAHPIQRLAPPVIARLAGSWGAPLDAREAEVVARHAQPGPSEVGDEPVLDALWALATAVGTTQQTA